MNYSEYQKKIGQKKIKESNIIAMDETALWFDMVMVRCSEVAHPRAMCPNGGAVGP